MQAQHHQQQHISFVSTMHTHPHMHTQTYTCTHTPFSWESTFTRPLTTLPTKDDELKTARIRCLVPKVAYQILLLFHSPPPKKTPTMHDNIQLPLPFISVSSPLPKTYRASSLISSLFFFLCDHRLSVKSWLSSPAVLFFPKQDTFRRPRKRFVMVFVALDIFLCHMGKNSSVPLSDPRSCSCTM